MIFDLQQERKELEERLMQEIEAYEKSGCQLAKNEAEYRKALRVEILLERANKTPVSIVSDICRGKPEIAELKLNRDCSEAVYSASKEAIHAIKLRLRILDEEITREWNSGGT